MKVTSQNYDAELGGSVAGDGDGSNQVRYKSISWIGFEFRRSDAQQARDPFAEAQRDPLTGRYIAPNEQNMFGGSIGGPVRKNKIFFFGDYQGVRQKTGSSQFKRRCRPRWRTIPARLAEIATLATI